MVLGLDPADHRKAAAIAVIVAAIVAALTHLADRRLNAHRLHAARQDGWDAGTLTAHQTHYDAGHIAGARYGHAIGTAGQPLPEAYLPGQQLRGGVPAT